MADYIGRWKCDSCSNEVWGIFKHCPSCGANSTGKFYLPLSEPSTTAEEVLKIIQAGPNWKCRHCESDNYGDTSFCTECGAEKGSSPSRTVREYGLNEAPSSSDEATAVELEAPVAHSLDSQPAENRYGVIEHAARSSRTNNFDCRKFVVTGGVITAILVVATLVYLLVRPYDVKATIDHFEWSRTIVVDQYRTVREGAWSIPSGGRYVSDESKVHHTVSVLSHYETKSRQVSAGSESYACGTTDNGNGTFSDRYCSRTTYRTESYQEPVYRQDPVYQTWYTYDIDRWVPTREVNTQDRTRDDPVPHWGQLTLACEGQSRIGCERENNRHEQYDVIFSWQDDDESRAYTVTEERHDWDEYDPQGEYVLRLNGLSQLLNDPLRPEEE
ncbi:MAG: hypothetical protein M3Q81_00390 [bacterium]|nr:hypothetical protein [bacterium]